MPHTIFHLSASFPISITLSVLLNALNTDVAAKYWMHPSLRFRLSLLLKELRWEEEGEQSGGGGGREGAERCDP